MACLMSMSAAVYGFSIGVGGGSPYYGAGPGVSFGLGFGRGYYPYGYYGPYGGYYYGGPGISFSLGSDRYYDNDYWDPDTDDYYE